MAASSYLRSVSSNSGRSLRTEKETLRLSGTAGTAVSSPAVYVSVMTRPTVLST